MPKMWSTSSSLVGSQESELRLHFEEYDSAIRSCVQPVASSKPKPAATGKRKEPATKGKGTAAKKAVKAK
jgi:hypothetical protein